MPESTPSSAEQQVATVEQLVRTQLAKALGGRRGIVESAVPTIAFTVSWVVTKDLRDSLIISIGLTALLLVVRIAQRSTPQFVLNALFGIGIGALFASRSGNAEDVFLPGILYSGAYAVALIASILVGRPLVGYLIGSLSGDLADWRQDPLLVRLCNRLTWLLAVPCIVRVIIQYPLWAAAETEWLGASKVVLGWPLQVAALFAMAWVLGRNATPMQQPSLPVSDADEAPGSVPPQG